MRASSRFVAPGAKALRYTFLTGDSAAGKQSNDPGDSGHPSEERGTNDKEQKQ